MHEEIPYHPIANIFPLLEGIAFRDLVEDIRVHGLIEPIVLKDGMILDGRNRLRACHAAQVSARFKTYDGRDPVAFVVSANLHRRHLDVSQRSMIAAAISERRYGGRRGSSTKVGGKVPKRIRLDRLPLWQDKPSFEEAAHLLNVSPSSVTHARRVIESGVPELLAAVKRGEVAVSSAATIAAFDGNRQVNILRSGSKVVTVVAREEELARKNPGRRGKREVAKVSIYSSFRVGDGRAIGNVRLGELAGIADSLEVAAEVIREVLGHTANPNHGDLVSAAVTERWLSETIDQAWDDFRARNARSDLRG